MANFLMHHPKINDILSMKLRCQLSNSLVNILNSLSYSEEMINQMNYLQKTDSLCNWLYHKSNVSSQILTRIQNIANLVTSKVKWSFLIEPGRPQTDLSVFKFVS